MDITPPKIVENSMVISSKGKPNIIIP
jgi:hypothetical protein